MCLVGCDGAGDNFPKNLAAGLRRSSIELRRALIGMAAELEIGEEEGAPLATLAFAGENMLFMRTPKPAVVGEVDQIILDLAFFEAPRYGERPLERLTKDALREESVSLIYCRGNIPVQIHRKG